jgi:isochorismate synthase EntC
MRRQIQRQGTLVWSRVRWQHASNIHKCTAVHPTPACSGVLRMETLATWGELLTHRSDRLIAYLTLHLSV